MTALGMTRGAEALRAIVFDFDGLILDTERSAFEATRAAFARYGVDLTLEQWHHRVGSASQVHWTTELQQVVTEPIDVDELQQWRDALKLELLAVEQVRPGVLDLLDEAEAEGILLAVASSSPAEWVVGHLTDLGLIDRFAEVVTRGDVAGDRSRVKPAPDLYQLSLERLHVKPESSVALEDSLNGIRAALAAGMACVAVPCWVTSGLDLSEAHLVAESLADLDISRLAGLVGAR